MFAKRNFRKSLIMAVTFVVSLFTYTNCDKSPSLVPLDAVVVNSIKTQGVQVNFCNPPPVAQDIPVKTLIIFDHSGSNTANYRMNPNGSGAPFVSGGNIYYGQDLATDPTGSLRYGSVTSTGTLLNYLYNLAQTPNAPGNPSHYFALIDFSSKVGPQFPQSGFTSDVQSFYNFVAQDASTASGDSGNTDYAAALTTAYQLIDSDIKSSTRPASYVVVFLSDGAPIVKSNFQLNTPNSLTPGSISMCSAQDLRDKKTDCCNPMTTENVEGVACRETNQYIVNLVESIVDLASNSTAVAGLNFFTVYYYSSLNAKDGSAQTLLQAMAKAGNGVSYSAVSGTKLDYSQFQPPQRQVQYTLQDVFVTNASGVWWTDGKFYADSDGDGLPDFIETQWGSDPKNPRTGLNGISDLVRYQLAQGKACTSMGPNGLCQDSIPKYNGAGAACSSLASAMVDDPLNPGTKTYASSDPSGLNDCEKILLADNTGLNNPDSNSDGIPDFLEFKNFVPFQSGTTPAINSPQSDGYSLYQKIKYSLPTSVSISNYKNLYPTQYNLTPRTSASGQTCYALNVTGLPIATAQDQIRVDLTFTSSLQNSSNLYKVGLKSYPAGSSSVTFSDWNDPTEVANKTWRQWP